MENENLVEANYGTTSAPTADSDFLQLLPFLPDIIVHRSHKSPISQTVHSFGVVMFADISGFTALCEKYCSEAKSRSDGVDQLTTTLNTYLSHIVQSILNIKGDILKFAGDALLAFWPCSRYTASSTMDFVLQESLQIQAKCDNFESSDGDILRMKIGVSIGKTKIHYIGNKEFKTFDITGPAITDVNLAQSECPSGSVVISKTAWTICEQQQYFATAIGKAGCAQVRKKVPGKESELRPFQSALKSIKKNKRMFETVSSSVNSKKRGSIDHYCRPAVKKVFSILNSKAQEMMRHFVSKTVVHKVDHGQDVDWLSEMREVSVLFINLDPGKSLDSIQTLNLLQTSFDVIYPCLKTFEGTLNKVFMFDKGCTFLCIFGLPHAKHDDDPSHALRAASYIYNHLVDLELESYSIGVTTGVAFCGVVGHPQRHEYTVIGQKVNMAARLMMKFPNTVTCEETTRSKATLPDSEFTLLPPVSLKGITDPENVYKVSVDNMEATQSQISNDGVFLPTEYESLIGRSKEMALFLEELMHIYEHTPRDPGVIILSGLGGIGKTKILRAMKAKAASMGFRIVSCMGGLVEKNTPLFAIKTIMRQLLELNKTTSMQEREQKILQRITEESMRLMIPLLNDIFAVKFPRTHQTSQLTHNERTTARHQLFSSIVQKEVLNKPCVFGIDDVHWVDHDSWAFLQDLALNPNAILVMTTRPQAIKKITKKPQAMQGILDHPHTKVVNMRGLKIEDMYTLACRLLNVSKIPPSMQQVISEHSHGVPLWVEELIKTMLEMNYVEVLDVTQPPIIKEEEEESVDAFDPSGTIPGQYRKRSNSVKLTMGLSIADIPIPDSVFGMVLSRIDYLSPPAQMSLKCAAIIGTVFNKNMLQAIVPNSNPASFMQSLNYLTDSRMIECAVAARVRNMESERDIDFPLKCPCLSKIESRRTSDNIRRFSEPAPINQCHLLQFTHTYLQETAYSLWTESQRKSLHEAAALFLESHKCASCGGEGLAAIGLRGSIAINITKSNIKNETLPINPAMTCTVRNQNSQYRRASMKRPSEGGGDQWVRICADNQFDVGMRTCNCDEVMASVYPQLVRHWRSAKNICKTIHYILLAASVAVTTNNNMEALSLLYEAKDTLADKFGEIILSKSDQIRLESLMALALFQSGEIDECLPHFKAALKLLNTRLPSRWLPSACLLGYHAFKQLFHRKFSSESPENNRILDPRLQLLVQSTDLTHQSRCLIHLTHIYYMQGKSVQTLMVAFKQLSTVEKSKRSTSELIESYTTIIECFQRLKFNSLACSYLKTARSLCTNAKLDTEGMLMYTHLLCVGTNLKLCLGNVDEALDIGYLNHRLASGLHDISEQLTSLPLLFFAQLSAFMVDECKHSLKDLKEVAAKADDIRAQAVYDCCKFDALLEFGVGGEDAVQSVKAAKTCCEEEIYAFNNTEQFFLVSCLALWYARHDDKELAKNYQKFAEYLCPRQLDTYLGVRALTRYIECLLVLHKQTLSQLPDAPMKKLKKLTERFIVFKARQLLFSAYKSYCQRKLRKARKFISAAIAEATRRGCVFDCDWALACQKSWFGSISDGNNEDTNIVFVLQ